ncbi:LOW QUALITY PROTEIN: glutathione hydrolase 5 proenzyme [Bombina bombina]|uniref:LOW QUALITY PROTEIN: glutathione hydrolase 5 proenzyme n=1 Tax=Bombina bombina TaxID=8345 RepID=UPI00235A91D2|nr:LOW QUALITY PROTEIN: glutathione hydrolase 5 proenzyme [Bombina bombina]
MAASRVWWVFAFLFILGILVVLLVVLLRRDARCQGGFQHGAVAADSGVCSNIGRDILKQGGSAVDGAIAALLCLSVMNPQSMGLGGGVIFTIYNASTGQVEIINARERAPSNDPSDLVKHCAAGTFTKSGVKWIGIPGELRGNQAAHQRYGRLPWKTLFEPTIKLITEGVKISVLLSTYLQYPQVKIPLKKQLSVVSGRGQTLNFTQLGHTLRTIAEKGADVFYKGEIAQQMLEDLNAQGSKLTLDEFSNYKVQTVKAMNISLGNTVLYTAPPPAGGALLSFILNILEGYNFSENSLRDKTERIETYHRIAEALKFANGQKHQLNNISSSKEIKEVTESLLSKSFAAKIRQLIDGSGNHSLSYYQVNLMYPETSGTTHVSVISKDGSSVSVTSSINHILGSMVYSPRTGIIFNNQMADFCTGDPHRAIKEGERPPSSMTPSILISKDKKFQLVIGGSGGSFITSATALAIMNKLWFGTNLTEAISLPVLYVNSENKLAFESSFDKVVKTGLQERGHQSYDSPYFFNVVQGVSQEGSCLFAHSDQRKGGIAAGY